MELSNLLNEKSLKVLNGVKENIKNNEERIHQELIEEKRQRKLEYYSAFGFKSRQELIDYVKSGNKIIRANDKGYMRLCPEKGENMVLNLRESYDEISDIPMGMECKYMTWDEFVKWTECFEDPRSKEFGYIECWVKETSN